MLIKSGIIKKIGLFDEIYSPAYYEDVDFCYRVKKMKYKIICYLNTEIIHYEGYSSKKRKDINIFKERNKFIFCLKHYNIFQFFILNIIFILSGIKNIFLSYPTKKDIKYRKLLIYLKILLQLKSYFNKTNPNKQITISTK